MQPPYLDATSPPGKGTWDFLPHLDPTLLLPEGGGREGGSRCQSGIDPAASTLPNYLIFFPPEPHSR
jgi:hypothetical protein